jgi:hypothetical protein
MRCLAAWILFALAAVTGCSSTLAPTAAVRDAHLGASVKTALVNDAQLGTNPIEVRVIGGVVRLTGRVSTDAQRQRAVSIARSVPGVSDVIADLRVGPAEPAPPPVTTEQEALLVEEEREPHLVAAGLSLGRSAPSDSGLGDRLRIGPLVRLGNGSGLGPAIGFGWFRAGWRSSGADAPRMGQIRIRPVLGGVAYGLRGARTSVSFSLLGGIAFNSLALPDVTAERDIPLSIGNSFAVRPGVSLWLDVDRRMAVNVAASYLMTRPRVRVLELGEIRTHPLRADAILINAGIVYKIF